MKKFLLIYFILLILSFECNFKIKQGKLYVTDQTDSKSEIVTLKILEHTNNQSTEKNFLKEYDEIITYKGFKWYVYTIPEGSKDIYIEYFISGDYGNYRQEVILQGDSLGYDWAAFWLVDSHEYSVWTEYGSGDFQIKNSLFKK